MQVLLIDAYAVTKVGRALFAAFERTVKSALEQSSRGEKADIFIVNNLN